MEQYRLVCLLYMSNATLRFWCGLIYYLWNPLIRTIVLEHQTGNFNLINPFHKFPASKPASLWWVLPYLEIHESEWLFQATRWVFSFGNRTESRPKDVLDWRGGTGFYIAETRVCAPSFLLSWSSSCIMCTALGLSFLAGKMKALG